MPRKKKETTDESIFAELAKETGGAIAADTNPVSYYIDSGNLALNYVCSGRFIGGGIPGGRMTEIFGPSGTAKSLWGVTLLRGVQKLGGAAILLDCENSLNPEFANRAGHVDLKNLIVYSPTSLEKSFAKIYNVTRLIRKKHPDVPILFVWDSLTVSGVERQMREIDLSEEFTAKEFKSIVGGKEQPGERSALCSKEFRKLQAFLPEQNATLFIINQVRTIIGAYGNPDTHGAGGRAMEFYPHCRLKTTSAKKFVSDKTKRPLGVNIKMKNIKSRDNTPFLEIPSGKDQGGIPLYFDKGIDPLGGLLTTLMLAGRVEKAGKGRYQVMEPWANGEEIKFTSSIVRNDVPLDLLHQCPAVIDAESKEAVDEYLKDFQEAIDLTNSDERLEIEGDKEVADFFDNDEDEE